MKSVSVPVLMAVLLCLSIACSAQNFNMSVVSRSFAQWQSVEDICVVGDYAYVSTRDSGLCILDVSDPAEPLEIACYEFDTPVSKSLVSNDILYVLSWDALNIFSVAEPADPQWLGTFTYEETELKYLALSGYYAYLAGTDNQFLIVNVSNPAQPFLESTQAVGFNYIRDMVVADGHLLIANQTSGLQIYDVIYPSEPQFQGVYQTHFVISSIAVSGDYVYVGSDNEVTANGLFIIDISQPSMPVPVGYMQTQQIRDISVSGSHILLRMYTTVQVVDVSAPQQPVIDYTYSHPYFIYASTASENRLFLGTTHNAGVRLSILDVSDLSEFSVLGHYGPLPEISDLARLGDTVFLTSDNTSLMAVSTTIPEHPVLLGELPLDVEGGPSLVLGSRLYTVVQENLIKIVDISSPAQMAVLGTIDCGAEVLSLVASGNYLYAGLRYQHGIKIFDVSAPDAVTQAGSIDIFYNINSMALDGDYLFVTAHGITVYDISNLSSPQQVWTTSIDLNWSNLQKVGDFLYATGYTTLDIFFCSNPELPVFASRYNTVDSINKMFVVQNRVYLACWSSVKVLERNATGQSELVGSYYTRGGPEAISADGNYVYVANSGNFLILYYGTTANEDEILPPAVMSVSNYPNPFRESTTISFELPRSGEVTTSIYNLRGQLIRTLRQGFSPAGKTELLWDGKDSRGNKAAKGIYYYEVSSDSGKYRGKCLRY